MAISTNGQQVLPVKSYEEAGKNQVFTIIYATGIRVAIPSLNAGGIINKGASGISCTSVVILHQINNMKLFVAGLPNDFDDTDLKEMFELYGEVKSARIVVDKATGKSKGFGFVDMLNKTEALETIEALDGAGLPRGKKIVVKEAEEQAPRNNNFGRSSNNRFNNNRY